MSVGYFGTVRVLCIRRHYFRERIISIVNTIYKIWVLGN